MGFELEIDPETLAGQMVVAGFSGSTVSEELRAALSAGRLSGVILFERNLGTAEEIRALTDALRAAAPRPVFIMIDHEGGRIQRLKEPFTLWPSARRAAEKADRRRMKELAKAMAAELSAVGINANLAPVLDVDTHPANPVIGDRSFGSDPQQVARLGAAMIEGFNEAGLVSCAKHFPGHGDTAEDSHLTLPVVEADRTTLERRELVPFKEAIACRVPLIMSAHIKAIALDPYYPATISRPILTGLLREELGFDGVIISDDLGMKALSDNLTPADSVFSAVRAGVDLLLVGEGLAAAEEARRTIVEGLKQGILDLGQVTLSARRVAAVKEEYLGNAPPERGLVREVLGCEKHRDLARSLW